MDGSAQPSRREVMIGGSALAAAGALPSAASAVATTISGVVFHDRSGTGKRCAGDEGLANLMVSNGRDIALTDARGRYTLPLPDEGSLFVVKPAGFMPPVDPQTQLPLFYRLHQPRGTPPDLRMAFPGIAPTGPLPASLDFPLRLQDEPDVFNVVLTADPQPASHREIDFVRDDIVDALVGVDAKFGITAGDLMFDDLSLYERYNRIIGTIGIAWWNIPGNHDLNYEAPGHCYSRETFKSVFGPTYFAFEYGRATFLMLDDVHYLGGGPDRYEGRLEAVQLEFVRNVLTHTPQERLVVLILHIPLRTYQEPGSPAANLVNRDDLFALLRGRRHTVSFSGHTHTTEHHYFGESDGWMNAEPHHHHVLTAACGSWWSGPTDRRGVACADSCDGSPNGFHILSIDGVSYKTRFVPAKEPNGRQVRVVVTRAEGAAPGAQDDATPADGPRMEASRLGLAQVVANVFDGGPRTRVQVTIDAREPVEMTRQAMADPFVSAQFVRNAATTKPWVRPELSSHIWAAPLPPDLAPGAHRILVSAKTEYGDDVFGALTLEVV